MVARSVAHSIILGVIAISSAGAADWPMWRCDPGRTGISDQQIPSQLHLQWVRKYPALVPAFSAPRQERVQFDLGYEPIVVGKLVIVGSNRNDSVIALDTETGAEKWRFYAGGPVRFAPAAWEGKIYFGSDDGKLYCLSADDGRLLWSISGAPGHRKVIGNGQLISLWPVRGGPVVSDGVVYFSAGIWPFEGIFVCAVDARTGKRIWTNDSTGVMYLRHPHEAPAFGGPSPQGYMLVSGNDVVAPSGRAFPAFFDKRTGKLTTFDFGFAGHGSRPASWFVITNKDGQLCVDPNLNSEIHDEGRQIVGQRAAKRREGEPIPKQIRIADREYQIVEGIADTVKIGGREFRFDQEFPGITGQIHTILAGDSKLFVVLRSGEICCFGVTQKSPTRYQFEIAKPQIAEATAAKAERTLQLSKQREGYALVLGVADPQLVQSLVLQSDLHVIAFDSDAQKIAAIRRELDRAALYGTRAAAHVGNALDAGLSPYLANLLICEDPDSIGLTHKTAFGQLFRLLRPYGGTAVIALSPSRHEQLAAWSKLTPGSICRREGENSILIREGALPGSSDYTGAENYDQLVASPLGVLWFGDTFHHHKLYWKGYLVPETGRGLPQTISVVGGVMKYATAGAIGANPPSMPYRDYLKYMNTHLKFIDAYTDIYTGRVISELEAMATTRPADTRSAPQRSIIRTNPLTGIREIRDYAKSHGCDNFAVDYGNVLTMRSGTAAYYDCTGESGLVNISGIRSGCRNTIIPANGVLCLPSWTGNCSCNYPLFTSLALVQMPEEYEEWAAWGPVAVNAPIRRVGINFGAPGDRMTREGTLWLNYPTTGEPSPRVPVQVEPASAKPFYRHSTWIEGGQGWPWVVASGVKGVRTIRIEPVAKRTAALGNNFSVRWVGSIVPQFGETYTFHVKADYGVRLWIGDRQVIDNSKSLNPDQLSDVSGSIALEAGRTYPIRIEYYHKDRPKDAHFQLLWSSNSTPKSIIPVDRLVTAEGKAGALTGVYYDRPALTGPAVVQDDSRLRFAWGAQLPEPLLDAAKPPSLPQRPFTFRLYFAEPEDLKPGQRVFSVKLQGRQILKDFDICKEASGPNRGIVREFKGVVVKDALELQFSPSTSAPALICGVELIAE